ncbi:MAG: D-sedoheptulose 7-phosphate isomerase [Dehalococcoidales bacterium]|nr:D-sedoheptulose 7-phosphate isomerase [Dehalococcoidales bacterium]
MMPKAGSRRDEIISRLKESIRVKEALAQDKIDEIDRLVELILETYKRGGKVVLLGNGGSAADAQHIAGELVGQFKLRRQALPAIALTTNTSVLTAIANDYGYESVFSRQVEALVNERDIVIGISTSGNSPNVIEAIKLAKTKGARTVALTGGSGGRLGEVADLVLMAPSDNVARIQEAHITIGHIVCELVEEEVGKFLSG